MFHPHTYIPWFSPSAVFCLVMYVESPPATICFAFVIGLTSVVVPSSVSIVAFSRTCTILVLDLSVPSPNAPLLFNPVDHTVLSSFIITV